MKDFIFATMTQSVFNHHAARWIIAAALSVSQFMAAAQSADEKTIRQIYSTAWLRGSPIRCSTTCPIRLARDSVVLGAAASVEWTRHMMEDFDFDSVWFQPVMVPHWVRGQQEIGRIVNSKNGQRKVNILLCPWGSVGTGPEGVVGNIIEVKSLKSLPASAPKCARQNCVFQPPDGSHPDQHFRCLWRRGEPTGWWCQRGCCMVLLLLHLFARWVLILKTTPYRWHAICPEHSCQIPHLPSARSMRINRVACSGRQSNSGLPWSLIVRHWKKHLLLM